MKYRPLNDRVIIERLEAETTSSGGLMLPTSSTGKSSKGRVLAVGSGKLLESGQRTAMSVQEGQIVLFHEGYGVKAEKIDGKEVLILSEQDILAILTD